MNKVISYFKKIGDSNFNSIIINLLSFWKHKESTILWCSIMGVNFINVLRAAFMHLVPKSSKNTVKPSVFLHFLDQLAGKLLKKCWWNWPLVPISVGTRIFSFFSSHLFTIFQFSDKQNKIKTIQKWSFNSKFLNY